MAKYKVTFTRSARKELEALADNIVNVIFPKIENLSLAPRPVGCRKLVGNKFLWRIRSGNYRIIYAIHDDIKTVDIIAVRDRKEAYQQLK
ncbi:MAG: type II toxin-antitoxin system RelE/ParE family toxin [Smithella sp.]|jgi:mRNA interferase RelE/StbE